MVRLDLNARRAARGEAENEPHQVVLGFAADGSELIWTLPPRMPLLFLDYLTQMEFTEAMRTLLGDQWERFVMSGPEVDDLIDIASELYGVGDFFGRPSPFPASSTNGGPLSKPTSPTTTAASTSDKPATARRRSVSANSSA